MAATDESISRIVDSHGWAVMRVEGDEEEPSFAYSIGLYKTFGHPEVIVFGLPLGVMQEMINTIGEEVRGGKRFDAPSVSADVLEGYDCAFREVAPAAFRRYMGAALQLYGQEIPAIHCVWPDREGHFPWDSGATAAFRRLQPMLSESSEPYTHTRPGD